MCPWIRRIYVDTQLYKVYQLTANLTHSSSACQATFVALCGFE